MLGELLDCRLGGGGRSSVVRLGVERRDWGEGSGRYAVLVFVLLLLEGQFLLQFLEVYRGQIGWQPAVRDAQDVSGGYFHTRR